MHGEAIPSGIYGARIFQQESGIGQRGLEGTRQQGLQSHLAPDSINAKLI